MSTAILRREDSGVEFFTVVATGQSGMSQSGLSRLSGVAQSTISRLEKTLMRESPSDSLEPWVGKALTLITKDDNCEIDGTLPGISILLRRFRLEVQESQQLHPIANRAL